MGGGHGEIFNSGLTRSLFLRHDGGGFDVDIQLGLAARARYADRWGGHKSMMTEAQALGSDHPEDSLVRLILWFQLADTAYRREGRATISERRPGIS